MRTLVTIILALASCARDPKPAGDHRSPMYDVVHGCPDRWFAFALSRDGHFTCALAVGKHCQIDEHGTGYCDHFPDVHPTKDK